MEYDARGSVICAFAPAFGRAVAASRRLFFGTPEGVPFRFGVGYGLRGGFEESGSRLCAIAHLSDDETVAKMGHPTLDMGHPGQTRAWLGRDRP